MVNNNTTMYSQSEISLLQKRNYNSIRELIRISYGIGVNLSAPTPFKDSLKVFNAVLVISSICSLYGHWALFRRSIDNTSVLAETTCTAFQCSIAIVKMIYLIFTQRQFFHLLRRTLAHEILQGLEIFHHDFPINSQLKLNITTIMNEAWKHARRQLIFYLVSCTSIVCNYFFSALLTNLYHQLKQTPNYKHILPFTGEYPFWEDKGMSFPYYHIQMYLNSCSLHIAGIAAVNFEGLFIVLCVHSVGLLRVLNLLIRHSTSPLVPQERRVEYLRCCIRLQQHIYSFMLEVRQIFKHVILSQFIFSLLIFACVLYVMNASVGNDKVTLVRMIMYIAAAGSGITIYCYNGQLLINAHNDISFAYYDCNWFNESREFRKLVNMMIVKSNRKFGMEVSWFTIMLATLIGIFRMSGSYFLLLRDLSS